VLNKCQKTLNASDDDEDCSIVKFEMMSALLAFASGMMMLLNGFVAPMKSAECGAMQNA